VRLAARECRYTAISRVPEQEISRLDLAAVRQRKPAHTLSFSFSLFFSLPLALSLESTLGGNSSSSCRSSRYPLANHRQNIANYTASSPSSPPPVLRCRWEPGPSTEAPGEKVLGVVSWQSQVRGFGCVSETKDPCSRGRFSVRRQLTGRRARRREVATAAEQRPPDLLRYVSLVLWRKLVGLFYPPSFYCIDGNEHDFLYLEGCRVSKQSSTVLETKVHTYVDRPLFNHPIEPHLPTWGTFCC